MIVSESKVENKYGKTAAESPLGLLIAEILTRVTKHLSAFDKEFPDKKDLSADLEISRNIMEKITVAIPKIQKALGLFDNGKKPDPLDLKDIPDLINLNGIFHRTDQSTLKDYLNDDKLINKLANEIAEDLIKVKPIDYVNFRTILVERLRNYQPQKFYPNGLSDLQNHLEKYKATPDNRPKDKKYTPIELARFIVDDLTNYLKANNSFPYALTISHPALYLLAQDLLNLLNDEKMVLPDGVSMAESFLNPEALAINIIFFIDIRLASPVENNPYVYQYKGKTHNGNIYYDDAVDMVKKILTTSLTTFESAAKEIAFEEIEKHMAHYYRMANSKFSEFIQSDPSPAHLADFNQAVDAIQESIIEIKNSTFIQLIDKFKEEDNIKILSYLAKDKGLPFLSQQPLVDMECFKTFEKYANNLKTKAANELSRTLAQTQNNEAQSEKSYSVLDELPASDRAEVITVDNLVEPSSNAAPHPVHVSDDSNPDAPQSEFIAILKEEAAFIVNNSDEAVLTIDEEIAKNPAAELLEQHPQRKSEFFSMPGIEVIKVIQNNETVKNAIEKLDEAILEAKDLKPQGDLFAGSVANTQKLNQLFCTVKPSLIYEVPITNLGELIVELNKYTRLVSIYNEQNNETYDTIKAQIETELKLLTDNVKQLNRNEASTTVIELLSAQSQELQSFIEELKNFQEPETQELIKTQLDTVIKLRAAVAKLPKNELCDTMIIKSSKNLSEKIDKNYNNIKFNVDSNSLITITDSGELDIPKSLLGVDVCLRQLSAIRSQLDASKFYVSLLSELNSELKLENTDSWNNDIIYEIRSATFISKFDKFLKRIEQKAPQITVSEDETVESLCKKVKTIQAWKATIDSVKEKYETVKNKGYSVGTCLVSLQPIDEQFNWTVALLKTKMNDKLTAAEDQMLDYAEPLNTDLDVNTLGNLQDDRCNELKKHLAECDPISAVISETLFQTTMGAYAKETVDNIKRIIQAIEDNINILRPVISRENLAKKIEEELDLYELHRDESWYGWKDVLTDDGDMRKKFINEIKAALILYVRNDNSLSVLKTIKDRQKDFPGENLQPLLHRIALRIKGELPLSEREEEQNKSIPIRNFLCPINQEGLIINPLGKKLSQLEAAIADLQSYSRELTGDDKKTVEELGNKLNHQLNKFLNDHNEPLRKGEKLSKAVVDEFKEDFHTLLHSQDDKMFKHHGWKKLIGNIAIGLVSLGTLLIASLVCTKFFGAGRAHLFFDETPGMQNVDQVEAKIDRFVAQL